MIGFKAVSKLLQRFKVTLQVQVQAQAVRIRKTKNPTIQSLCTGSVSPVSNQERSNR